MQMFFDIKDEEKEERKRILFNQILKFAQKYAKIRGYVLNPNKEELEKIIWGLVENQINYGFRYCPCRILSNNKKEDAKKICPCFWHKKEIEEMGHCHCRLFWNSKKVEKQ